VDVGDAISFSQLAEISGFTEAELRELVEYGALIPVEGEATTWSFSAYSVYVARRACRLSRDFDLDAHGLSVVLRYVERIEALEGELRQLRAQLPK
jgi:hypothetical protein